MNIDRLNYLYEVSKTNSISIAAENLHVTQSTISQAITSVENELGVTLFIRSRRGTFLTFEGKKLMVTVKELLNKAQELMDQALQFHDELSGNIRIAAIPGLMKILLRVFARFKKEHPNVELSITEKNSMDILNDVRNHQLDIGLINFHENLLPQFIDIQSEIIYNSQVRLCVSKNSHLALKETVSPEDLKHETIVLYNEEFILSFSKNLMKDIPLKLLFVTDNVDAIRAALNEEIAVTIATDSSIQDEITILNGQIVAIPFVNIPNSHVPFGLIRPVTNKQVAYMTEKFLTFLKRDMLNFSGSEGHTSPIS